MSELRSKLHWAASGLYFFLVCPFVVVVGVIVGPRRVEGLLTWLCHTSVVLAGARVRAIVHPDVDPRVPCFFVCNHVNLFDPFVIYPYLPQVARGIELESHFRVPVYGWMMKHFGNVPVPDERTAEGLRRTYRLTKAMLDRGIGLIVFPEASRTRDGLVGPFEDGVFRMAHRFGAPIVPVTIEGAFRWCATGTGRIVPGPVTVHLHAPVDARAVPRDGLAALREQVRATIAGPLGEEIDRDLGNLLKE